MAGARGQGRLERSRAIAAALGSAVMTLYFFVAIGLLFWVALLLPDHPEELELIAILFITMSAVLGAALATALLYKLMGGQTPHTPPEEVFWAATKRYAWIAAPIAAGYGFSQIVSKIIEALGTS